MSMSEVLAGKSFVEVAIKDLTERGLNSAAAKLRGFSRTVLRIGDDMTALGAAITGPLLAALPAYAAIGEELDLFAQRTGFSADMAAEMREGLIDVGLSLGTLQTGMGKFSKLLADAAGGSASARSELEGFGLSVTELQAASPDRRLELIADALARIPDPGMRSAAAMQLLGKGGADLLPILAQGAAGLEAVRAKARALGETGDGTAKAAELSAAYDDFGRVWKSIPRAAVEAIAGPMTQWFKYLVGIGVGVKTFVREHQGLISIAFKAGAVIGAVGKTLVAFAAASKLATMLQSPLTAGLVKLAGAGLAFLTSPIGLVTAALVAGIAAWAMYTESGQAAIARLKEVFGPLMDTIKNTIGGIKDALMSGNFSLAAEIAGTGIKLGFLQALGGLGDLVGDIFGPAGEQLKSLGSDALQGNWEAVVADLGGLWANFCGGIVGMMMDAVDAIVNLWSGAVEKIANWLLEASEGGGVMGAVASKMLGVDMSKEADRGKLLDMKTKEKDRKLSADIIPAIEQDLAAAKGAGDTERIAALERFLAESKSKAAGTFGYDRQSTGDAARDGVSQQVAGWKDAVKDWTADVKDTAAAQASAMSEEADARAEAARTAQGTQTFDQMTGDLAEKLKRLTDQAAAEKADFDAKMKGAGDVSDQGEPGSTPGAGKSLGPIGTFSAYALNQQLGTGQGTQERLLQTAQEQKRLAEQANEMWREIMVSARNNSGPSWGRLNTDGAC